MKFIKFIGGLLLFSSSQAIQLHWSPPTHEVSRNPTLRDALAAKPYHVALAPIRCATILLMSILQNLKENKLSANIASLSGSSTGGLAAAIWASVEENDRTAYTHLFGKNFSRNDCSGTCSPNENLYLNFLDSPVSSELEIISGFASPSIVRKYTADFANGFRRTPSTAESTLSWIQTEHLSEIMSVKHSFSETKLPVVISGLFSKGSLSNANPFGRAKSILMSQGNLRLALLATTSPPGNTRPIQINKDYAVTDGYFGDEHGARGYDALQRDERPSSMLNILLTDLPKQVPIMDFSVLRARRELKQAVTVEIAVGSPVFFMASWQMARATLPHYTYKDIMRATHAGWSSILDQPLEQDSQGGLMSYVQELNLRTWLPDFSQTILKPTIPMVQEMEHAFNAKRINQTGLAAEYRPEGCEEITGVEVTDEEGLLQNPEMQQALTKYNAVFVKAFSGPAYRPAESWTGETY